MSSTDAAGWIHPADDFSPVPLLHRVARGEPGALAACVQRYRAEVWGIVRRSSRSAEDAEDVVQEVFLDLWRSGARFDPQRGSEAGFVRVLTHRRLIDEARARRRRPPDEPLSDDLAGTLAADQADPEGAGDRAAAGVALARLRPVERELVIMATCDGLSHAEIARSTGLPLGTVKSRLRRALARLRAWVEAPLEPTGRRSTSVAAPRCAA